MEQSSSAGNPALLPDPPFHPVLYLADDCSRRSAVWLQSQRSSKHTATGEVRMASTQQIKRKCYPCRSLCLVFSYRRQLAWWSKQNQHLTSLTCLLSISSAFCISASFVPFPLALFMWKCSALFSLTDCAEIITL